MYSPRQVIARSVRLSIPNSRHGTPCERDFARAASALGRALPADYFEFQRAIGGREVVGLDVLRLALGVDDETSLVERNLEWRSPRRGIALPADVIAFASDGAGNLFCFDVRSSAIEPPIVLWDPLLDADENLSDMRPLFASFIEWLEAELDLVAAA